MLSGSLVAIVTPMAADGALDLPRLKSLIDWHVKEGTDGIVIVGTTGESPTVDVAEHCRLIESAGEFRAGARRQGRGGHRDQQSPAGPAPQPLPGSQSHPGEMGAHPHGPHRGRNPPAAHALQRAPP